MVQVSTGGGNRPLTKDEQIENLKKLCSDLINESEMLKLRLKELDSRVTDSNCPVCGGSEINPYKDHFCCYNCGEFFKK